MLRFADSAVLCSEWSRDCGCTQGLRFKRISKANRSGGEAVDVAGSLVRKGLELSPTGNKWLPGCVLSIRAGGRSCCAFLLPGVMQLLDPGRL